MSGLSSVYPPPPPYYKRYTKENVEKLNQLKSEPDFNPSTLPEELQQLLPPEVPVDKPYRSFGNVWQTEDKLQSLKDVNIKQLYGSLANPGDRIRELKKLLKSLLVNYLELVGIMSINPEQFPGKVEDMRVILINIHHLLNEYRPHQSRENLILLMEEEMRKKRQQIDHLKESNRGIVDKIQAMANKFDEEMSSSENKQNEDLVLRNRDYEDQGKLQRESDIQLWNVLQKNGL
ncbi:mediator of RNA polymerase II transcription subunit 7 [Trichomonascus vanleenenianus]|uniref:mediator complex subunit MED7 n=1 Tax=Trichomonascus vanleenenianus TaxID=2268995 RepID=UPI003ECAF341